MRLRCDAAWRRPGAAAKMMGTWRPGRTASSTPKVLVHVSWTSGVRKIAAIGGAEGEDDGGGAIFIAIA